MPAPAAPLLDVMLGRSSPNGDEADQLQACLDAPLWVDAMLSGVPYPSADALLEQADAAARALPVDAVLAALHAHPRIGERASGDTASARMSRLEQSGVAEDAGTTQRLAEANAAYEAKFGHVFLIRAAGLSSEEILAAMERRMEHEQAVEIAVSSDQLRQIALLRLEATLAGGVGGSVQDGAA